MNKLLLIDGNSLVYRAYFGTAYGTKEAWKNSQNIPVNAVLTFWKTLQKTLNIYNPTHVFVAFDKGKKTKRHDKFEGYKAGRAKTPDDLIVQFPIVKELLTVLGIKYFEVEGIEADDIIATIASSYQDGPEILVLSSDKDLFQLVNKNISIIVPQNGIKENVLITNDNFFEKFKYYPNQVPDIKALMGDTSDNLPGVKGIGKVGAEKLISQFSTIENMFANLDQVKSAREKQLLINNKELCFLCKELAVLIKNVDIPYVFDDFLFNLDINNEFLSFLKKYELKSIQKQFLPSEDAIDYSKLIF